MYERHAKIPYISRGKPLPEKKDWGTHSVVKDRVTGEEFYLLKLYSQRTALVYKLLYGAIWRHEHALAELEIDFQLMKELQVQGAFFDMIQLPLV